MQLRHFYLVLAAILGLNTLLHLFHGNLLRALLSALLAGMMYLEFSGRPTLGRVWRAGRRLLDLALRR